MLQILLFYFCVAHVVLKFDYHMFMQISNSIMGLGLGGQFSGLGLVGKVSLTSLVSMKIYCIKLSRK